MTAYVHARMTIPLPGAVVRDGVSAAVEPVDAVTATVAAATAAAATVHGVQRVTAAVRAVDHVEGHTS